MKVGEVKEFAFTSGNDIDRVFDPDSPDAVERNLDAEVTWETHNLTTDEIEILMNFIDHKTDKRECLGR